MSSINGVSQSTPRQNILVYSVVDLIVVVTTTTTVVGRLLQQQPLSPLVTLMGKRGRWGQSVLAASMFECNRVFAAVLLALSIRSWCSARASCS